MAIQPFNQPQFGMQQQQQGQQPQAKRQRGTGFTNIGRMLGANIGAGQQMAQQVGKTIGAQAGQVQQGALKSQQAFKTGFETAKEKGLQDIGRVGGLAGQVGETGQVGAGLSGMSEEEAKKLGQQFAETKYTGPMGLEGQVGQRAQSLKGLGQQAITGQRELIGSTLARRGPYTRGQSLLDVSLVGQDRAAQEALRASALEAMRTGAQAQQQEAAAKSLAEGAQALIGGDTSKGLGEGSLKADILGKLTKSEQSIKDAATKAQSKYTEEATTASGLIKNVAEKLASGEQIDYNKLTDQEKDVLDNLNTYGIPESLIGASGLNKTQLASVLNTLNVLSPNIGAMRFEGGQKEALRNIALLGGQEKVAKDISEMKDPGQAFSKTSSDQALQNIKNYLEEDKKTRDALAKNVEIGNLISRIKNIKDQGSLREMAQQLGVKGPRGELTAREATNLQNQLTDILLQRLDPTELSKVRQWQTGSGRTVGQLGEMLQGSIGQANELTRRLNLANKEMGITGTPTKFRDLILKQIANMPIKEAEPIQTISKPTMGTVKPKR